MDKQKKGINGRLEPRLTGNVAMDMLSAAILQYAKAFRKIKVANLSSGYWKIFKTFMEVHAPELDIPKEGIQFNNILVRKGSMFQKAAMTFDLYPVISVEDRLSPEEKKAKRN